jgi:diguanylate cyclase (GGDEF)-like protein
MGWSWWMGALKELSAGLERLWGVRSNRRLLMDAAIIFGAALVAWGLSTELEAFEWLYETSRQHEDLEIDEWVVAAAILSMALLAFGARRIQDQRRELALRRTAEEHARLLALHDPLTGLPNRRRFTESLAGLPRPTSAHHALMLIDLDGFKGLNDVFGHASGDEALKTIAHRLKSIGDERILPARLGGDEFALLIRNLNSTDEGERIAQRVIDATEIPVTAGGAEHRLQVSIGIALMEQLNGTGEEDLRRADVALYRAKAESRSAFRFYSEAMDVALRERIKLERQLKLALTEDRIIPHYQPIVDLQTGQVQKFEALARWHDPTLGEIPPTRFISLAEERSLIADLTDSIMRRACRDALAWPSHIVLAVNLSPVLLQTPSFPLRLFKILADTGLPPSRLEIEITEKALKADSGQVRQFIQDLRLVGVRIALDDFGTGYSSLSRLKELPFDEIKIDGSFVQSLAAQGDSSVIVRAIIELGRGLGIPVTAECVEEPGQRDALLADGCRHGQGFLFSKAVPAHEVNALLGARQSAA